ncbi:MAG: cation transporter dimerization domain-containing protein, partial [Opitutales bacterium]
YHELRHRNLGDGHWVDFHLLFQDDTPIKTAHAIATEIERTISESIEAHVAVTTHLEPTADHRRLHKHPADGPGEEPPNTPASS